MRASMPVVLPAISTRAAHSGMPWRGVQYSFATRKVMSAGLETRDVVLFARSVVSDLISSRAHEYSGLIGRCCNLTYRLGAGTMWPREASSCISFLQHVYTSQPDSLWKQFGSLDAKTNACFLGDFVEN